MTAKLKKEYCAQSYLAYSHWSVFCDIRWMISLYLSI